MSTYEYRNDENVAWCPGCGNYAIREALIDALSKLHMDPHQLVVSSGIGQAAKMPQYLETNYFNGLHGRALPVACAIKSVNPELTVIAEGGDGDMYGEGGNHLIHNIRRNIDITHIVHNNMVYGLTKGQASPTSSIGFTTPLQEQGVINEPFNPLLVALSLGATFIARGFSGYQEHLSELIQKAILHPGYALIDVMQPCPSFNKINNFAWYKKHTYMLEQAYKKDSLAVAFTKAQEHDPYPLGILYRHIGRPTFEACLPIYKENKTILIHRKRNQKDVQSLIDYPS